jgi:(p)ppGpp synthase/HD superfamily hydrolase
VEDLLAGLGYGEITQTHVVNRLREITIKAQQPEPHPIPILHPPSSPSQSTKGNKSPIAGVEGLVYHLAGCCHPLPGQPILGVVTRSAKGISIHQQCCPNVEGVEGERLIFVKWNNLKDQSQTYPVDLIIEALDRVGVFKDILSRLSDQNINVRNAGVKTNIGQPALISLQIDIKDHEQLEHIMAKIKNMGDILHLRRVNTVDVG